MQALTFTSDHSTPFVGYACALIQSFLGVRLVPRGSSPEPVDVYHGNDATVPCAVRIPLVERYSVADAPSPPAWPTLHPGRATTDGAFPFDLFAALRFWITDEGNAPVPSRELDEHGRLPATRSAQHARDVLDTPIVNAYLLALGAWLAERTAVRPTSRLPPGKRCTIVLSHDVDSPLDPGTASHAIAVARASLRTRRAPQALAYATGAAARARRSRRSDPRARHFVFDEIIDEERRRGFSSTFFFAAVSRFAPQGGRRDVGYDIRADPLPRAIRSVVERGHGVGLHIGYAIDRDGARIAEERRRLEAVAGVAVHGSRHHYWHMSTPFWASLAAHGRAGLIYDSSVGFNDAPGFRLGIAAPFYPWDPESQRRLPTLQVPTFVMDSQLCGGPGATVETAVSRLQELVDSLKRFEGVAAVDWHEYTSVPGSRRTEVWGRTYLALLDLLASDREVSVQTYEELVADTRARWPGEHVTSI